MLKTATFKEIQLRNLRVKNAYEEKETKLKKLFVEKRIVYNGFYLFIRAFKREMKLEAWVKEKAKDRYTHLLTFDFCASSGKLGPKRKEGDKQIPEGIYFLNNYNPLLKYHLGLGVSYPNASDKKYSDPIHPGGAVYIHGDCIAGGCIPVTNDKIKELYLLAVEARNNGQEKIAIHIFPTALTPGTAERLAAEENVSDHVRGFWKGMERVYQDFENRMIPSQELSY